MVGQSPQVGAEVGRWRMSVHDSAWRVLDMPDDALPDIDADRQNVIARLALEPLISSAAPTFRSASGPFTPPPPGRHA